MVCRPGLLGGLVATDLDGPPAGMASALVSTDSFYLFAVFGWHVCRMGWHNGCLLVRRPLGEIVGGPEGHAECSLPAHNLVSLLD